jgi:uncharacterized protein YjbJ (UPF0337 family)
VLMMAVNKRGQFPVSRRTRCPRLGAWTRDHRSSFFSHWHHSRACPVRRALSKSSVWRFARGRERLSLATVEILNLRRNTLMNEDRLTGNAKNLGGQVEEGLGQATGDIKGQLQGKARQAEGALQDVYGQVKETASDAAEAIRKSATGANDFLRTTIEERPYTAAAIALGIGYLIGRLGRRDNY